jgi:peptidoglycan hydrolase-like protein with peptidoglycan-binding domain/3D (Asp-Asp-Asp) domain-containing protein
MYYEVAKARVYPLAITLSTLVGSIFSPVYAAEEPYHQEFVVTAYYSAKPNQCCYFRGNYDDEITFNGRGTNGADGTPVYPGMIAAPPTYAFGTRITLDGLGTATVHDRGSRIIEWGEDLHRIDIWMGYGEEGLARALAWGVRRVKGTVYPVGWDTAPTENLALSTFPADTGLLATLPKPDPLKVLMLAKAGDDSVAVRALQSNLQSIGYFKGSITGTFGDVTRQSLKAFLMDARISGDGTEVTEEIAAALSVATEIKDENLPDLSIELSMGSRGDDVKQVQKLLRFLGFYRGRTDGIFDRDVRDALIVFQQRQGIIGAESDTGAGRVGPVTRQAMLTSWRSKIVSMKTPIALSKMHLASSLREAGLLPGKTLVLGDRGKDVRLLQAFLADHGYLDQAKDVTGTFGNRTFQGLLRYQMDSKIVSSETAHGAGVFGPATRSVAFSQIVATSWNRVRGQGMQAL